LIILSLFVLAAAGCSRKEGETTAAAQTGSGAPTAVPIKSKFDDGPRAAEAAVDEAQAEQGEQLFKDKACSACHTFGQKLTGPDLAGVTRRRTAHWIEQQILHPEKMVKEDPISRELFAKFALQMPNQGLTEAQARAIIEYFKHHDRESADERSGTRAKESRP
jgi:mono/diheme cytochrome c family protein